MSRSKWKNPFTGDGCKKASNAWGYLELTQSRSSKVLPNFLGQPLKVHNGKLHSDILVTESMIDLKFGSLVPTRAKFKFKRKKKSKGRKKKK